MVSPMPFQPMKFVPVGPVAHQVRIGDQHARRIVMRAKNADRFARSDQQRLVVFKRFERPHNGVERFPASRRAAACRRRRPDRQAARRPRDPGCSSACAARLPGASPCNAVRARAAHESSGGLLMLIQYRSHFAIESASEKSLARRSAIAATGIRIRPLRSAAPPPRAIPHPANRKRTRLRAARFRDASAAQRDHRFAARDGFDAVMPKSSSPGIRNARQRA